MTDTPTRSQRQREQRHIGDPPRRTMPVGHVLVAMVVALVVGSLLNAPGIYKTALGQDVGFKRDVATFFAEPLADVSNALFLDRPRAALQWAIGRDGDDDVDLTLPSPTISAEGDTPPAPPPKQAFSPDHQLSMYVTGDSLSITPGESIVNQGLATGVIGLLGPVDGHVATGLARPEVFNWPGYLASVLPPLNAGAVVLTIGSNDDQSLTGEGGTGPFGSPEWQTEYRRRVGGLMDQVTADGTTLFWVGIPPMRNTERFDTRYKLINEILKTEAEKRPGKVVFVDIESVLSPFGGGYADYLENPDGTVVQVRAGDGIHFTRAGGDRIAAAVIAAFSETFDLDSWKTAPSTTTPTTAPATPTTKQNTGTRAKEGK
jgi:uncharacterized protein